jgi:hypothetical protein
MVALFLIGVTIFTDLSWIALAEGLGAMVLGAFEKIPAWWQARRKKREEAQQKKQAHEKRAKVTRSYLISLGVDTRRLGIVSYGRLSLAPHLEGLRCSKVDYPWLDIRREYA